MPAAAQSRTACRAETTAPLVTLPSRGALSCRPVASHAAEVGLSVSGQKGDWHHSKGSLSHRKADYYLTQEKFSQRAKWLGWLIQMALTKRGKIRFIVFMLQNAEDGPLGDVKPVRLTGPLRVARPCHAVAPSLLSAMC